MRLKTMLVAGFAAFSLSSPALAFDETHEAQNAAAQPAAPANPAPAPAQLDDTNWQTELGFEPEAFRGHVMFLADDLLEGREAGQRGHEIAARYVASQFAGLGLQPAVNGSWFQQVPFGVGAQSGTPTFSIGNQSFPVGEGVIFSPLFQGEALNLTAPVVFVGYGRPEDYRGIDARGKIVVVLGSSPQGLPSDVAAHFGSDKRRVAGEQGAVGMISLRSPQEAERAPMARARQFAGRPATTWVNARGQAGRDTERVRFVATIEGAAADALFAGASRTPAQIFADLAANRPVRSFALRQQVRVERATENSRFTSPNVIGIIPGTDPALANEYVLLTAHLDHIGISAAGTDPNADRINNGAMDNATGIATLLEVARHMMQEGNRPRRPVIIAAVTAEEKGLLGASYLAENPVVQGRIIANVNLDMPILTYDFRDVVAFGAEHSSLSEAVARAAGSMNVGLIPDPLPQEGLFVRSDHYPFVTEGVPAVFLMTGFGNGGEQQFQGFLRNQYHSPRDQLNLPFDWRAGARFAELNYRIAREIANAPQAPRWYADSYFGRRFGGDQPRATRPAAPAAANSGQ